MRNTKREDGAQQMLTQGLLRHETTQFRGTGGVSSCNRNEGFRPAFLDTETDTVYLSRFSDGRPAPFHLLDGLPDELVLQRNACGRAETVKAAVVSGFVRAERFYNREEAAQAVVEMH